MALDLRSRFQSIVWIPKFQALGVHFGISLLIFITLLYFIFFQWYPSPFFTTDGGTQGLRLIIFVDLVLGPILTFIVFNRKKPSLKFDLVVIALLQVAALSYGVWAVYNERPVAIVFADDRFHPIPYYEFVESGHKMADLKKFGDRLPVMIYVELPTDTASRMQVFKKSYQSKTGLFLLGDRYRRIDKTNTLDISSHAVDIEAYLKQDFLKKKQAKMMQATYRQFIAKHDSPADNYLYLPLFARYCNCFLVTSPKSLQVIDVLEIPPPQITQSVIRLHQKHPGRYFTSN